MGLKASLKWVKKEMANWGREESGGMRVGSNIYWKLLWARFCAGTLHQCGRMLFWNINHCFLVSDSPTSSLPFRELEDSINDAERSPFLAFQFQYPSPQGEMEMTLGLLTADLGDYVTSQTSLHTLVRPRPPPLESSSAGGREYRSTWVGFWGRAGPIPCPMRPAQVGKWVTNLTAFRIQNKEGNYVSSPVRAWTEGRQQRLPYLHRESRRSGPTEPPGAQRDSDSNTTVPVQAAFLRLHRALGRHLRSPCVRNSDAWSASQLQHVSKWPEGMEGHFSSNCEGLTAKGQLRWPMSQRMLVHTDNQHQ